MAIKDLTTCICFQILSDNVYIELITFTHSPEFYTPGSQECEKRESHPWAEHQPGWIDYAFLGFGSSNPAPDTSIDLAEMINGRANEQGAKMKYDRTVDGGRRRPDGKELRWRITAPNAERHGRGLLPFFCGDVTERRLRVSIKPIMLLRGSWKFKNKSGNRYL